MVLFPIAFLWICLVLLYVYRRSRTEPAPPGPEERRWRRRPRGPRSGPHGRPGARREARRRYSARGSAGR